MNPNFKITYKTSENEMFELTIPNAFNFDPNVAENITRVNTAAKNIMNANAIETSCGDLSSIESIAYCKNNITMYDLSDL